MIKKQKQVVTIISVLVSILLLVGVTYAWFISRRSVAIVGSVHAPTELILAAGHQQDIAELYLGSINVTDPYLKDENDIYHKYYIFAVCGAKGESYYLQLAYTWNIPFTYRIYGADEIENETDFVFFSSDNHTYYYDKKALIPLTDCFQYDEEDEYLASDKKQKYADPYYQQTVSAYEIPDQGFNYYILEVSWSQSDINAGKIANNKETDLIYLVAGTPEKDK